MDEIIRIEIRKAGLQVHELRSTNGQVEKWYPGFDLKAVNEPQLRVILQRIFVNIERLTA